MHKMSKDSANQLAAAYAQVAKYREAFDIAVKYMTILINYSIENKTTDLGYEQINVEFRKELKEKVGVLPNE